MSKKQKPVEPGKEYFITDTEKDFLLLHLHHLSKHGRLDEPQLEVAISLTQKLIAVAEKEAG